MERDDRRGLRQRRLAPGRVPDPLRAHGAWVYLIVSILAGATVASGGEVAGLLAGTGLVGIFLLAGAAAVARRRAMALRSTLGLALATAPPLTALAQGAERSFLAAGLVALPPLLVAAGFAARRGFLSPGALAFGVTALTVAAPVAALAGGARAAAAGALFLALTPFFFWRTWRLARALGPGWTRQRFQRRGLVESALAVGWAAAAATGIRLLG